MFIDSSLTFKKHIRYLKVSCLRRINLLELLSNTTWGADRKSLFRLYIALLRPKLNHGCEAYGSVYITLLNSLQLVRNAAIKIAAVAFRTPPVLSFLAESGIKSLEKYREIKIMNYCLQLRLNEDTSVYDDIFRINRTILCRNKTKPAYFVHRVKGVRNKYKILADRLAKEPLPSIAPWKTPNIVVCNALLKHRKSKIHFTHLKMLFLNHLSVHSVYLIIL